ncbi:MAG: DUF3375 domain-containing protein [Sulfuricellaceae bacterium]
MNYDYLRHLRDTHPAWRLLTLENAPLIAGFLHHAFIRPNKRAIPQSELIPALEDYLYDLRLSYGEDLYPRSAKEYLDTWAHPENAFLRKYYPPQQDEPEFDLSAAAEKALEWLASLQEKQFVGTESRLLTIFELLRELVHDTERDSASRIAELTRRKVELEQEISRLSADGAALPLPSSTQVKERFFHIEDTARRLLSDFRQVEANFRELDAKTRSRIALAEKSKAELLTEIFGEQDAIGHSDQGKSFQAFWDFLMSLERREELQQLIAQALALPDVAETATNRWLENYRFHLSEAGEKVQRTAGQLAEQLRRYLDSQIWLENKRIAELIHRIEKQALAVKHAPPDNADFMTLPEPRAEISLPLLRSLYAPPRKIRIADSTPALGDADFAADALFNQHYVDEALLRRQIRNLLEQKNQASLAEVIAAYPVRHGLAEIVAYLKLAQADRHAAIDDARTQALPWRDHQDRLRSATAPLVLFSR